MKLSVGLIGYGYWGPNVARNIQSSPDLRLAAVCDQSAERLERATSLYPQAEIFREAEALIARREIDAVVIAVPLRFHHPFALKALASGKHVLVEKPMASSVAEAMEMIEAAKSAGRALVVDHTFLEDGAVQYMRGLIDAGELGRLTYYDATRINLGLFQSDTDVVWDLGPHDISILDYLFGGQEPVHIVATGHCHVNEGFADMAFVTLHYADNRVAHLLLSWMSPVKIRRVLIAGERKMAVWNDLAADEKVRIYDTGIHVDKNREGRQLILPEYRTGDIWAPRVERNEPLGKVLSRFAAACRGASAFPLDGESALRTVRLLEKISAKLKKDLKTVSELKTQVHV